MKIYVTVIGILMTINGFSQKDMFIDLHITPLYCYRDIKSTNSLWNDLYVNILDSIEQPNSGLSYGISYEISLTEKFYVSTGLDRTKLSEKITREIISTQPFSESTSYSETLYNTYDYIGIPLQVTYNIISNSHWNIGFIGSVRLDILTKYEIEKRSLRNDNSLSSWTYNKLTLCSSAGLHFEYVMKRVSIYFNPSYSRYLTTNAEYSFADDIGMFNNADTEIKQHNYYFGAEFGIKYRINNR